MLTLTIKNDKEEKDLELIQGDKNVLVAMDIEKLKKVKTFLSQASLYIDGLLKSFK